VLKPQEATEVRLHELELQDEKNVNRSEMRKAEIETDMRKGHWDGKKIYLFELRDRQERKTDEIGSFGLKAISNRCHDNSLTGCMIGTV